MRAGVPDELDPVRRTRRAALTREERVARLQEAGQSKARLYLADEDDGVGGAGAFFLLLDEPEVYGLPPDPVDPRHVGEIWGAAGAAAAALGVALVGAFMGRRR